MKPGSRIDRKQQPNFITVVRKPREHGPAQEEPQGIQKKIARLIPQIFPEFLDQVLSSSAT